MTATEPMADETEYTELTKKEVGYFEIEGEI